VKTKER